MTKYFNNNNEGIGRTTIILSHGTNFYNVSVIIS